MAEAIARTTYLNVRVTKGGNVADFRASNSWGLEQKHGLQDSIEICYARRHDGFAGAGTHYPQLWFNLDSTVLPVSMIVRWFQQRLLVE